MDRPDRRARLTGCYVTVPTQFKDEPGLPVNFDGIRQHVRFLIDGGLRTGTGLLLAAGAAGDFSTLTFDERVAVAECVIEAADGRLPVAMGAQSTSTLELVRLAKAAERIGADFIQVSPPFYFSHTEQDFLEYVLAAADAADVGLIIYNTYWTSTGVSTALVEKLVDVPNVDSLKWSAPDTIQFAFEEVVQRYSSRFQIIDNQSRFALSHMLGAQAIEIHIANHWPQWAVKLWQTLEARQYPEAQAMIMDVLLPYMRLWDRMEQFTSGDGYLDKLCMELVGLPSSRNRPPTRDVRERFREETRQMLLATGVPNVVGA
ncbi:MAG: dihydrodipicolinate synthase family protein [Chloroflexota bacterium]